MMEELKTDKIDLELSIGIIIVFKIFKVFNQLKKILRLLPPYYLQPSKLVESHKSEEV